MRFRFIIRDLLWLTLVVALAVGWWLDHRRLSPKMAQIYPRNPMVSEEEDNLLGEPAQTTKQTD